MADDGEITLTWLEPAGDGSHRLRWSRLEEETWSAAETVAEGSDFFANWADTPAAISTPSGLRLASWLAKLGDGTYAYGAFFASAELGDPWQAHGLLHDDTSPTEHGFVSWLGSDPPRAFWLDGRAMSVPPGDEDSSSGTHGAEAQAPGAMQLRTTALSTRSGGVHAEPSERLDERVCECCSTDAAMTTDGAVLVYRDRSEDEVRDISIVRQVPGGWSEPRAVHVDGWKIFGCPVNGPAVAAQGRTVAVAWFTAADDRPRVQLAWSRDGGTSFGAPQLLDGIEPVGRVDVAMRPGQDGGPPYGGPPYGGPPEACVTWIGRPRPQADPEAAEIRLACATEEGLSFFGHLAATTAGRAAGVPRVAALGRRLFIAWTEATEPSKLRVVTVD